MQLYVYLDRDGKMPQLRREPWESKTHPYYIRYVNDVARAYHGPPNILAQDATGTKVWCYATRNYVPINSLVSE
jgi:hypothetical protein